MEDEQFYGKYRQYLAEKGGFPNRQQLDDAEPDDDSASDDQQRRTT